MNDILFELKKNELEYDLDFDFGIVDNVNNGLLDILNMQRNFLYKDCILVGNYNPIKNDKGLIIFVSKIKYPCFIPFFFMNNSDNNLYGNNDVIISSKGDYEADTTKLESEFIIKVNELCNRLGINSNDLLMVINFESGFNAQAINPISKAVGLIQFLPSTAISLGTTVTYLFTLNKIQQLEYVEKYFQPYKNKLKNLQDVCMAIFYPIYIGKSSTTVFPDNVQKVNKGIVTIQDYVNLVINKAKRKSGLLQISGDGTIKLEH